MLGVVLSGISATAQEPRPLTHVAVFKVKPDKTADWVATVKKVYVPVLQKQMADGNLVAYGVDTDTLHRSGEGNADAWYVTPNWSTYEKVSKAIDEAQRRNAVVLQPLMAATDPDKHVDMVMRSQFTKQKTPPAGKLPYTSVSVTLLKPGKGQEYRDLFEKYSKPLLDKLVDNGVIYSYSLDQEVQHSSPPNTRWLVMSMDSLGAMDKIDETFKAAFQELGEEGRAAYRRSFDGIVDGPSHRDFLLQAHVFASK